MSMTIALPGFAEPVGEAQATFRAVLDAMARPGKLHQAGERLAAPVPLDPATAALLLTLADNETPLWLDAVAVAARDWLAFAHRTFKQAGERIVPDYDPQLATILAQVDVEQPLPPLWKEFDSLADVPMLVIRGSNSDILSSATVAVMRERRAALEIVEVPDQGHAPLLAEPETIQRIADFIQACDAREEW